MKNNANFSVHLTAILNYDFPGRGLGIFIEYILTENAFILAGVPYKFPVNLQYTRVDDT
jgi:hypothetical protein